MGKTLIDNSLAALTDRAASCLDKEADCVSYLLSFNADKQDWNTCRQMLISKFPNGNIPTTKRQNSKNLIQDCVEFFKTNVTADKYKFVISDLDIIPGLQTESIALLSSTLSTIRSLQSTISKLQTIKPIQKESPKSQHPPKLQSPQLENSTKVEPVSKTKSPPTTVVTKPANSSNASRTLTTSNNKKADNKNRLTTKTTFSSILKAPVVKSGSWTPSTNAPAAITKAYRLWLKTSNEVTTQNVKSWTSNWNVEEGTLDVKYIVKNTFTNSFFVAFKSKSNVYKDFIPANVKYSNYINKNDPLEHDKRLQVKPLYLKP